MGQVSSAGGVYQSRLVAVLIQLNSDRGRVHNALSLSLSLSHPLLPPPTSPFSLLVLL